MSGWAAIDPGRSKCGLALSDPSQTQIVAATVLAPEACWQQLKQWQNNGVCEGVLLGDGTGSQIWLQRLRSLPLELRVVPEAGTTLAARQRYWQLEPPRGWRRLLPKELRVPPRDIDDVVAQLLLERHFGRSLRRSLERNSTA